MLSLLTCTLPCAWTRAHSPESQARPSMGAPGLVVFISRLRWALVHPRQKDRHRLTQAPARTRVSSPPSLSGGEAGRGSAAECMPLGGDVALTQRRPRSELESTPRHRAWTGDGPGTEPAISVRALGPEKRASV